jgi:hypothetical protein
VSHFYVGVSNVSRVSTTRLARVPQMFHGPASRRVKRYATYSVDKVSLQNISSKIFIFFYVEPIFDAQEPEGVRENSLSDDESEQSESESYETYLTCDSGVSDDEGSSQSCSNATYHSGSRKRTRSSSDSEFSDALDR